METLPPEPVPLPPAPVSAHRQVLAALDRLVELQRPELWRKLRSGEDVLVDAKAVDERVRAGEELPLAGMLVAAPPTVELPAPDAVAIGRLAAAGAVVLGAASADALAAVVALEIVDVALGAGQVAAASEGVVGLKPTRALVPRTGIAPAGVEVFARTVAEGQRALEFLTGPDESDPGSAPWPDGVRLAAGDAPRIAVPARVGFANVVEDLLAAGAVVEPADFGPFLDAARESYDARAEAARLLRGFDALLVPALAEYVGSFSTLDLAAVTVPPGVSVVARAFEDQVAIDIAAFLADEQIRRPCPATGIDLVVFGAHLRGQPLNTQLTDLGARFLGDAVTAGRYRMVALPDKQPGVLPVAEGAPLVGERWKLSPAGLGRFLTGLSGPMSVGEIELADGSKVLGLRCDQHAAASARDITEFGDWRAYLRYVTATRPMTG
ncbi:hypothetical protein FPZ12_033600 [Amycolatopsis acidicola]|uniref:Allophanate hydrolase C-terminal domain-containing protein n=1 Tax=Amycolatopsis acidicola TaxID=2596893 RepID=A0A5N0UV70_9PSEU|nr:amidase family protein [Amycolatopsis acidicola]KAA9153784.1 hypothetical protein FPZ12_033600 [Amycolatopsis acidicola]